MMLTFHGVVTDGIGRFGNDMIVPGVSSISSPIRDWPDVLHPGTFNVLVRALPPEYLERIGPNVAALDHRKFLPEAELGWAEIERNTLTPTRARPDRGNAQIWRATIKVEQTGRHAQCWVLRRIGSGYRDKFECVAAVRLRDELAVVSGDRVRLEMEGRWAPDLDAR